MTPTEVTAKLRAFNDWRRGHHEDTAQPDPREIGEAIDAAIEMIERLDAAEKERDWHAERCEDAMNECAALRAKIEAAEKSDAESLTMYRKARDERDALRVKIGRMEKRLRLILEEPENTMSNSKAMREMIKQARLALEESK